MHTRSLLHFLLLLLLLNGPLYDAAVEHQMRFSRLVQALGKGRAFLRKIETSGTAVGSGWKKKNRNVFKIEPKKCWWCLHLVLFGVGSQGRLGHQFRWGSKMSASCVCGVKKKKLIVNSVMRCHSVHLVPSPCSTVFRWGSLSAHYDRVGQQHGTGCYPFSFKQLTTSRTYTLTPNFGDDAMMFSSMKPLINEEMSYLTRWECRFHADVVDDFLLLHRSRKPPRPEELLGKMKRIMKKLKSMKETIGGEFRLLMRTNDGFFFGRIFQSMGFVTTICYSHSRRGICLTVYVSFFSITKKK